jgi:hypothetical protein
MKVDHAVKELARMFPAAFTGQGIVEWARMYRTALAPYEGAALRAGFDEVLPDSRREHPPRPRATPAPLH